MFFMEVELFNLKVFSKNRKKDLYILKCNRFCNREGVKYITEAWGIPPIDKGEVHYEKALYIFNLILYPPKFI